jgi:hypothetical protein
MRSTKFVLIEGSRKLQAPGTTFRSVPGGCPTG